MSEQQCVFRGENQVLDSIAQMILSRKTSFGCTRKCSPRTQSINLLGNLDKFHKQWGDQWVCGLQFRELACFVPKNGFVLFSGITILDGPPGYKEEVRSTATVR